MDTPSLAGSGTAATANAAQRVRVGGRDQRQVMAGVVLDPRTEALLDAAVEAAPPLPVEARMRLAHLLRCHQQAFVRDPQYADGSVTASPSTVGTQSPDTTGSAQ